MGHACSTSTSMSGSTGNVGIFSQGGPAFGMVSGVSTGSISFSSAAGSGSTVANATGKRLRIFYHKEQIELENLLTTKMVFKPQAEMSFIELQPKQQLVAPSVEEGFASVFVADPEDGEVYVETISLNFPVPYGACCIVTAKKEVKFRKCDGGVWIDEDGCDHYCSCIYNQNDYSFKSEMKTSFK